MSEANGTTGSDEAPRRGRDLGTALRKARVVEAERSDVVVDLRAAEIARLELLREEVAAVVRQVPPEHASLFDGGLVPGFPPRLWVDILTFVEMSRDKRVYRLLRDGRDGRALLHECADLVEMADRITDFIAHRIIERERALRGAGAADMGLPPAAEPIPNAPRTTDPAPATPSEAPRRAEPNRGAATTGLWARLAAAAAPPELAPTAEAERAADEPPPRRRAAQPRPAGDAGYASPAWAERPRRAERDMDEAEPPRRARPAPRGRRDWEDEEVPRRRPAPPPADDWDDDEAPRRPARGQGEFRRSGWRNMSPAMAFGGGLLAATALIGLVLVALTQLGIGGR